MPDHHHVAIRVANMEQAIAFYASAFDATVAVAPFVVDGEFAETVMAGPAGVRWRTAILSAGSATLELFEFESPTAAIAPVHPSEGNLIHFGMRVDDVSETLARVGAAGGRRHWPEIVDLAPGARVIYVRDLDENLIELPDVDPVELAHLLNGSSAVVGPAG